jgi:hypothetical protein
MTNAVAFNLSPASALAPCLGCKVVETDDSFCDWCHFWLSLAHEPTDMQEWVMEDAAHGRHYGRRVGCVVR